VTASKAPAAAGSARSLRSSLGRSRCSLPRCGACVACAARSDCLFESHPALQLHSTSHLPSLVDSALISAESTPSRVLLGCEAALEARATTYIGDRRRRSRLFKYPLPPAI